MSMRTWNRKMAHEKAERLGIKHMNKLRFFNGKIYPSKFALNWRDWATIKLPKISNKKPIELKKGV